VPGAREARGGRGERAQFDLVLVVSSGAVVESNRIYTPGASGCCPQQKLLVGWFGRLTGNKQYRHGVKKRTGI
jgi:hypothetical protein